MKTGFYALLTCAIFAGLYFVLVINMQNTSLFYGLGAFALVVFIWSFYSRSKKAAKRKYRENMFQQHMRMTLRNQWH
jgi:ABC-type nickel/cobalt efflux system permease component RcnA